MTLLHENEREIYGDTGERCHDIVATVGSPALRMAFDPANFVQVGVRPMDEAWPLLADYTTHIHIKDALFDGGAVRPAGQGDGAIPELLRADGARLPRLPDARAAPAHCRARGRFQRSRRHAHGDTGAARAAWFVTR